MKITRFLKVFILLYLGVFAANTQAAMLNFNCITNNLAADCDIGESQLTVEVTDAGGGQVLFEFFNTGPEQSTISEIYFDDGSLLAIATIDKTGKDAELGVSFSEDADPSDLPGGNSIVPAFNVTTGFLADADNPAPTMWGVNIGESVGITYSLKVTKTITDVIDELTTGDLRIGLHVINFENSGSESFVNAVVPIPAAIWLFGSGLIGLVGIAKRKKT